MSPLTYAAEAKNAIEDECAGSNSSFCIGYNDNDNPATKDGGVVRGIIDILSYAAGILAVILIIFGGFRYVKSNGDSSKITDAKNTIIYALVGVVVVVVARQLILFVLNRLL